MEQTEVLINKFTSDFDVSRETVDRLLLYRDLLLKWQRSTNLISPTTVNNVWERHFYDSAQLFLLISDKENPIFDLGSGGGFPGLVLAIMGASMVHLIDSDHKKGIFLSEVIRRTQASAQVHSCRIEAFTPIQKATTITSRACAPLTQLLDYTKPLLAENGECLFMKGQGAEAEVDEAKSNHMFHVEHIASRTHEEGHILRITNLR